MIQQLDSSRDTGLRRSEWRTRSLVPSRNSFPPCFYVPHGLPENVGPLQGLAEILNEVSAGGQLHGSWKKNDARKRRAPQVIGHLWRCTYGYITYTVLVISCQQDWDQVSEGVRTHSGDTGRSHMRIPAQGMSRSLLGKY